jgi:hypothetical protein
VTQNTLLIGLVKTTSLNLRKVKCGTRRYTESVSETTLLSLSKVKYSISVVEVTLLDLSTVKYGISMVDITLLKLSKVNSYNMVSDHFT